jgi:hypothetical protein
VLTGAKPYRHHDRRSDGDIDRAAADVFDKPLIAWSMGVADQSRGGDRRYRAFLKEGLDADTE